MTMRKVVTSRKISTTDLLFKKNCKSSKQFSTLEFLRQDKKCVDVNNAPIMAKIESHTIQTQ